MPIPAPDPILPAVEAGIAAIRKANRAHFAHLKSARMAIECADPRAIPTTERKP
jgi:hypothetical protein